MREHFMHVFVIAATCIEHNLIWTMQHNAVNVYVLWQKVMMYSFVWLILTWTLNNLRKKKKEICNFIGCSLDVSKTNWQKQFRYHRKLLLISFVFAHPKHTVIGRGKNHWIRCKVFKGFKWGYSSIQSILVSLFLPLSTKIHARRPKIVTNFSIIIHIFFVIIIFALSLTHAILYFVKINSQYTLRYHLERIILFCRLIFVLIFALIFLRVYSFLLSIFFCAFNFHQFIKKYAANEIEEEESHFKESERKWREKNGLLFVLPCLVCCYVPCKNIITHTHTTSAYIYPFIWYWLYLVFFMR